MVQQGRSGFNPFPSNRLAPSRFSLFNEFQLLPLPRLLSSISVGIDFKLEHSGDGVQARQLRRCGGVVHRAPKADAADQELPHTLAFPGSRLAILCHDDRLSLSVK